MTAIVPAVLMGALCLCSNAFGQIGEPLAEFRAVFGEAVPKVAKGGEVRFKTVDGIDVLARFSKGRAWEIHFLGVMSEKESLKLLEWSHPRWKEIGSDFDSTRWQSDDRRFWASYHFKSKHLIVETDHFLPKRLRVK